MTRGMRVHMHECHLAVDKETGTAEIAEPVPSAALLRDDGEGAEEGDAKGCESVELSSRRCAN